MAKHVMFGSTRVERGKRKLFHAEFPTPKPKLPNKGSYRPSRYDNLYLVSMRPLMSADIEHTAPTMRRDTAKRWSCPDGPRLSERERKRLGKVTLAMMRYGLD